jgi:hypothetical protein
VASADSSRTASDEDKQYVYDLGLTSGVIGTDIRIANDIYREIIARALTSIVESDIGLIVESAAFVKKDGSLDFTAMISGFQQFFRENAGAWKKRTRYDEAAPQLLLQAWLQRVVNSGGSIEREYALGSRRCDIFARYYYHVEGKKIEQRFVLEIKVVREHSAVSTTIKEGLSQIANYADMCAPEEAHLVIINPKAIDAKKKVFRVTCKAGGRNITVWGM